MKDRMLLPVTKALARQWASSFPPGAWSPGQTLFYAGHRPYGVYLLHSGSLELHRKKRRLSAEDQRVDGPVLIGLYACLSGNAYPLHCRVLEPSEISFVERGALMRLILDQDRLIQPVLPAGEWSDLVASALDRGKVSGQPGTSGTDE